MARRGRFRGGGAGSARCEAFWPPASGRRGCSVAGFGGLEAGAEGLEPGLVAAHAVGGPVDRQDGAVVEEPVEDRGRDGLVVEDLAPAGDAAVGGEDRAVLVAAGDDLEEVAGGLGGERQVAQLVALCGYPHSATRSATSPSTRRPPT